MPDDMETTRLQAWVGRRESAIDILSGAQAAALAATLDRPAAEFASGAELPPLWHWLYFTAKVAGRELGGDGHPRRGGFLPPITMPRRMWAGGRLQFHRPLRIGETVRRDSVVTDVRRRDGRSGALIFVTVQHRISVAEELAISEEHDIVYRDRAAADTSPAAAPAPSDETFSRRVVTDPVLLFRYSALTFNGHRIHYDRAYAVDAEGYPGLVVHGPLIATLLVEEAMRRSSSTARPARFEFTAKAALFDGEPVDLCGRPAGSGAQELWARGPDGRLAMSARLELAA